MSRDRKNRHFDGKKTLPLDEVTIACGYLLSPALMGHAYAPFKRGAAPRLKLFKTVFGFVESGGYGTFFLRVLFIFLGEGFHGFHG